MRPLHLRLLALCLLILLLACGFWARSRFTAPLPPIEVSLWYWHSPFSLPKAEVELLNGLGVKQLFVHAGEFKPSGSSVSLILPQDWQTPSDIPVVLVFNFNFGIVLDFKSMSNDVLARDLVTYLNEERERAEKAGIKVSGFQLDFDCPTKRLPKYAEFLSKVRDGLGRKVPLSITALPTWFSSKNLSLVLDQVDFYVPQFYERDLPKTLDKFIPVSSLKMLKRGLKSAGRLGKEFYAGIPSYGHTFLFDRQRKFSGVYRDLSFREAMHHPAFRFVSASPINAEGKLARPNNYIGEDLLEFVATRSAPDGRGLGYHLVYDIPTPELIAQYLEAVKAERPKNCRGVILFRYPEAGETMTLPLPSIASVLRGEKARPGLQVNITASNAPWELVETGRKVKRSPIDLNIKVTNTGSVGSALSDNAVVVELVFDQPGLEIEGPGDFSAIQTAFRPAGQESELASSALRANILRLKAPYIAAGESIRIGPIRVIADGATTIKGHWQVVGPGGFNTIRGKISIINLSEKEGNRP